MVAALAVAGGGQSCASACQHSGGRERQRWVREPGRWLALTRETGEASRPRSPRAGGRGRACPAACDWPASHSDESGRSRSARRGAGSGGGIRSACSSMIFVRPCGRVVFILKAHDAVADKDQARIGNRHAMGVAAEIFQHLLGTAPRRFGIDDPRFGVELLPQGIPRGLLGQRRHSRPQRSAAADCVTAPARRDTCPGRLRPAL